MAYITNAVYNKLVNSRTFHKANVPPQLYDEIIYHFGVDEVLSPYDFSVLGDHVNMTSGKHIENQRLAYLQPKKDLFLYVFEREGAYKYHLFEDCIYLNNDFNNYIVPEEIRHRGQDLVSEYRNWFINNGFDKVDGNEREIISKITFNYNSSFAKLHKLPPLNESYKLIVSLKNSTYQQSQRYYSLSNVGSNIRKYVKEYKASFTNRTIFDLMKYSHYENAPKHIIEQKVGELTTDVFIQNYGYEKLINHFREANRIKYLILNELKLFINFRCGFKSNDFSKEVLESYGLVCCKSCLERFDSQN